MVSLGVEDLKKSLGKVPILESGVNSVGCVLFIEYYCMTYVSVCMCVSSVNSELRILEQTFGNENL